MTSDIEEWRTYKKVQKETIEKFRHAKAEAEGDYLNEMMKIELVVQSKRDSAAAVMETSVEEAQDEMVATLDLAWKAYIDARIKKGVA
jgi:DNA-binding protein H-NS